MATEANVPAAPEGKILSIRDIAVEDIKTQNPELYARIGKDYARAEKDRENVIKGLIADSGCDAQLADTLFVRCKDMSESNAKIEISRTCGIEAALAGAKMVGLDDEDLKHLRSDVKDLPQISATRTIQSFVNAKLGAKSRLVKTPDPAVEGKDPIKSPEGSENNKVTEAVAAARKEYAENFADSSKTIMGLTEKDYVEQYLQEKEIKASDLELKAVAPDLFK